MFHKTISTLPPSDVVTKRILVADVARIFDAFGYFAPVTVKMKILLQRVWEQHIDWDDPVPETLQEVWHQWRCELLLLMNKAIP